MASAVKWLIALRLESTEINLMSTQSKTEAVLETRPQVSAEGIQHSTIIFLIYLKLLVL